MKKLFNNWHWLLPLLCGLLITENVVHFFVMTGFARLSVMQAFAKLFKDSGWMLILGYLFITPFRMIPFAILSAIVGVLSLKIDKRLLIPTLIGGLTGIFIMMIPAMASVWKPLYTGVHVSSTAVVAFLFIPIYSVPYMFIGVCAGLSVTLFIGLIISIVSQDKRFVLTRNGKAVYFSIAVLCLCVSVAISIFLIQIRHHHETKQALLAKAESPEISHDQLLALYSQAANSWDPDVLAKLAKNPRTSVKLLQEIYALCLPRYNGYNGFGGRSYPQATRFHLARNDPYPIFLSLALNPKTPSDILVKLATRHEDSVRLAVGTNPNTPLEVLETLSMDRDYLVRTWLSTNPKITRDILVKLKADSDKVVRSYAESAWARQGFLDK